MVGIYKITNPEGKAYIGLSREIEVRWNSYKNMQFQSNTLLKESFKKYGYSNHIFEVIEEITLIEDTYGKNTSVLRKRERYWISKLNTFYDGLNQNGGGSGCGSHTKESKQKISKSLKGKPKPPDFGEKRSKLFYTDEWRQKLSEASKGKSRGKGISRNKGRISPNKGKIGKTRSEETKQKISEKNSIISLLKAQPIFQYNMNNIFIQEFSSQKYALEFLGKSTKFSGISDCLNGRVKSSMGYIWKYEKI